MLSADKGFSFTFGHDCQEARAATSGVLSALGVNTLLSGTDAGSIAVNESVLEHSSFLAAASNFLPGDGANAGRIAALDSEILERLHGQSIPVLHNTMSSAVAVTASGVNANMDAADTILSALRAQRESISGVNLDEEAISLLKFERAFQGAARYIRVVDDLLSELVLLVR